MFEISWQLHTMGGPCKVVELGVGGSVTNFTAVYSAVKGFAGVSWNFKQLNLKAISIFRPLKALTTNIKDTFLFVK